MSEHLDELRADLASALAHELGIPLAPVEAAIAVITEGWSVTRKGSIRTATTIEHAMCEHGIDHNAEHCLDCEAAQDREDAL